MQYLTSKLNQRGAGSAIVFIILSIVVIVIIVLATTSSETGPASSETTSSAVPVPGFEAPLDEVVVGGESANEEDTNEEDTEEDVSAEAIAPADEAVVINYTNNGFSPEHITISQGEAVTFINDSSRPFWPATAVHPTHRVYPGSDIRKCRDGDITIFDACQPVEPGTSYSFAFLQAGKWQYHDHLKANFGGTIIVQ